MNKIIGILCALSLAIGPAGCQAILGRLPAIPLPGFLSTATPLPTATPEATATPLPTATPEPTPTAPPDIVVSARQLEENSDDPKYEMRARWPVLEWGGDERAVAFNQSAEAFVNDAARWMRESAPPPAADPIGNGSSLYIDYEVVYSENGVLAVLFRMDGYAAGAAHPWHASYSLNYDLQRGRMLSLDDLFLPGSAYLNTLSRLCLADLKARGVLEWEDGAQPTQENYQDWVITADGLLIIFEEYMVAPYAAGPQQVIIPYADLQDLANPEGPLAVFLQ